MFSSLNRKIVVVQFIQSICFTVVTSFIEGSIITCDVSLASALEFSLSFTGCVHQDPVVGNSEGRNDRNIGMLRWLLLDVSIKQCY